MAHQAESSNEIANQTQNGTEDMDCGDSSAVSGTTEAQNNVPTSCQACASCSSDSCSVHNRGSGRKRPREEFEDQEQGQRQGRVVEKRGCEEGMSWWTCLMLGISQERARPQVVRKVHENY